MKHEVLPDQSHWIEPAKPTRKGHDTAPYGGRIIIVQPALPPYRVDFFSRLADHFGDRLKVMCSPGNLAGLVQTRRPSWVSYLGPVITVLPGIQWQDGAAKLQVRRGDIIVVCGAPRCVSTLVLLNRARRVGAHTIWWGHFWTATTKSYRMWLRVRLMRLADEVLFYTDQEVTDYLAANKKGRQQPVKALNNGIDVGPIQLLRAPYVPNNRPLRLLFIGRLTSKARLNLLISALNRPELADVCLECIGDGPAAHDLKRQADALGVSERIRWHGALVDETKISAIANCCRLFVYPGSVGLSLLHAFSYGLPAIVHNKRWRHMPEISAFDPNWTGANFQEGSSQSLAASISNAIYDTRSLTRWSRDATATADCRFNTTVMARRFINLISEIERGTEFADEGRIG